MAQLGILYGVSVGTGEPELLTIKAVKRLQQVSVVAFPAGVNGKKGMAEQIIAPWLQPEQILLPLRFPYLQDDSLLHQVWQEAGEQVWHYLQRGQDVVFACEGDVSFYSTFTYLAQTLEETHPEVQIERIPGVSSPFAIASVLGLPLTVKDQRLVVLPALYHPQELQKVLEWADVVVLMKVSSVYAQVWQILKAFHCLETSYVVERATLPDQKIYRNLATKPNLKLSYFSLLLIQNPLTLKPKNNDNSEHSTIELV